MSVENCISSPISNISRRQRTFNQKGLTLVEIIVVLVLLGIVMTFLATRFTGKAEQAKAQINSLKMKGVQALLGQYQLQYNSFPPSLDGLSGCNEQTGPNCVPIANEAELRDAWDTPYLYTVDSGGRSYQLKSLGADKRAGGSGADGDAVLSGP